MDIKIYTDGSNRKDGGGFGVVGLDENNNLLYAKQRQCINTTNNREELKAIIEAVTIARRDINNTYIIYSDSSYCVKAITEWMPQWANNGWKNSKKKEVENIDLMKQLFLLFYKKENGFIIPKHTNYSINWLKGHDKIIGNE